MASLSGSLKALTVLFALSLITACASLPPPSADTVYVNGKIITVDKAFTIAQAVAVKDGRFVGVGTSEEMLPSDAGTATTMSGSRSFGTGKIPATYTGERAPPWGSS